MIYAAQVPWRSWIQALSRNHKTSGAKCYKLDWNPVPSNSLLGGSENHTLSISPFREPRFSIGMDTRKTIAVQLSLMQATQAKAWFAGSITTCSR
jgi:hypothetical protein